MRKLFILLIITRLYPSFLVISEPGFYRLGQDISFNTPANDSIISIESSDVVLDLADQVLTQLSGSNATGIQISDNLSNITIFNGVIANTVASGIEIGEGCSSILIESVEFRGVGNRPIECNGTSANPINQSTIRNCDFLSCAGAGSSDGVIILTNVIDSELIDLRISSCGRNGGTINIFRIESVAGLTLEEISIEDCQATTLTSFQGFGTNTSCVFNAIRTVGNQATTYRDFFFNNGMILEDSELTNITSIGHTASGLMRFYNKENSFHFNVTFDNCLISGNQMNNFDGFYLRCRGNNVLANCYDAIIIKNSIVAANDASGSPFYGFFLQKGRGVCDSNYVAFNSGSNICYGINMPTANPLIDHWELRNNRLIGQTGTNGIGLFTNANNLPVVLTSLFVGNVAYANQTFQLRSNDGPNFNIPNQITPIAPASQNIGLPEYNDWVNMAVAI